MKAALLKNLLKYGLGLGLLAYVIIANWNPGGGRPGLSDVIKRPINIGPLLLALLISMVGLLITFLRWHLLVRAVGLTFSRYDAIRLGLVGYFFNTFLPGSLGGDVLKAYSLARGQTRRTVAVATVLIDRVIGLWALVWFVTIVGGSFWLMGDPLVRNNPSLTMIIGYSGIAVIVTAMIWITAGLFSDLQAEKIALFFQKIPKIGGSLAELARACWMYRKQSRAVLKAMLMSMVGHTLWVLVYHLAVQVFQTPNPAVDIGSFPEHLIIVPVGMTIQAIFPSPGGIGGGEAAFGGLYKILGKPEVNGIVGCLAQRVIFWILGIIGYIVYSRMKVKLPSLDQANQDQPLDNIPDDAIVGVNLAPQKLP
ncbi:MAG: flippase-like domain-containing protein [Planctomycetes bacterium]|nr:flippase-like domain-containing protein [Planctomycetota bacterium]